MCTGREFFTSPENTRLHSLSLRQNVLFYGTPGDQPRLRLEFIIFSSASEISFKSKMFYSIDPPCKHALDAETVGRSEVPENTVFINHFP